MKKPTPKLKFSTPEDEKLKSIKDDRTIMLIILILTILFALVQSL